MNVILLAAGEGTRLKPYTLDIPKPAIPFLSVPLGFYSLSLIDELQIDNLVINTYHLPEKIEDLFTHSKFKYRKLLFSRETPDILDSGGGIHQAKNLLLGQGRFLVMNADEVLLPHQRSVIKDLVAHHDFNKCLATILTINHPEVGKKFGGIWVDKNTGKVQQVAKTQPAKNLDGYHYVGAMVLSDRIFNYFKNPLQAENIFYDTLNSAIQSGEDVFHFNIEAEWFETGNEHDFLKASSVLIEKLQTNDPSYWLEYLRQTIRVYGGEKPVVEKDQLLSKINQLIAKIYS